MDKKLHSYTSKKEIAAMFNISYDTLRRLLHGKNISNNKARLTKVQVISIFRALGFPEGYEHYEKQK
jgi:hypothetical protein